MRCSNDIGRKCFSSPDFKLLKFATMVPRLMVTVSVLWFVTWFSVQLSCSWLSDGVSPKSDFCENIGVASVVPIEVSFLAAAAVGTIIYWKVLTTPFSVAPNSTSRHCNFLSFG